MYDQEEKNIRQGLKSPSAGASRFSGVNRPDRGNFHGIKTPGKSDKPSAEPGRSKMKWGGKSAPSGGQTKFGRLGSKVDGECEKGGFKGMTKAGKSYQKP